MRRLAIAATIAALTFFGGQAAAAATYLKYEFTAFGSDFDPQITGSFTAYFDVDGYQSSALPMWYIPFDHTQPPGAPARYVESCTAQVDGLPATCDPTQVLETNLELGFFDVNGDMFFMSFDVVDFFTSAGVNPYYFEQGTFLTRPGLGNSLTYQTQLLSAQQGQLVVTEVDAIPGVPEPGAWALMLVGVGLTGAALRTQRAQRRRLVRVRA